MNKAYLMVLTDSGILGSQYSTSDLEAGLYSLLTALAATDTETFSGSTLAEAYSFVAARLEALGVNQWILTRYKQTVAARVAFHSRNR